MYLTGIGVFIKRTHGEKATQGDRVCGTQILFHTHECVLILNPHTPTVLLYSLCSLVSVIASVGLVPYVE